MQKIGKWWLTFLLRFINPHQPYGTKLFDAIARISVSVAFEAVALRKNHATGEVEVFMTKRAEDDTAYPGQWHVPGSVLRPKEHDDHVLVRLSRDEFGVKIVKSKFIAIVSNPGEKRGHFISLVYRVQLVAEPKVGEWFPIHKLPPKTVDAHRKYIIPLAARAVKFQDIEEARVKVVET